ncbi:MAG: hypothetical protein WBX15_20900 [Thermoanaerobaculia bacterium]
MTQIRRAACVLLLGAVAVIPAACTGGEESSAHEMPNATSPNPQPTPVEVKQTLSSISPAIPIYEGARFNPDLTREDQIEVHRRFGPAAQVYTFSSSDSFPQVWHYYVTYLAQFRAYDPPSPYPDSDEHFRTIQVRLNPAMQDPFIPGDTLDPNGRQVILQVAETGGRPQTLIRYVLTPPPAPAPQQVAEKVPGASSSEPATR